jgi:hypothetical protein
LPPSSTSLTFRNPIVLHAAKLPGVISAVNAPGGLQCRHRTVSSLRFLVARPPAGSCAFSPRSVCLPTTPLTPRHVLTLDAVDRRADRRLTCWDGGLLDLSTTPVEESSASRGGQCAVAARTRRSRGTRHAPVMDSPLVLQRKVRRGIWPSNAFGDGCTAEGTRHDARHGDVVRGGPRAPDLVVIP